MMTFSRRLERLRKCCQNFFFRSIFCRKY